MELVVVGMNHETAPIAVRERFSAISERGVAVAQALKKSAGATETLVLGTCNRFEVYAVLPSAHPNPTATFLSLEKLSSSSIDQSLWYLHRGEAAARHLFRVASGLDAMAVGETQVLAQLKMAYQRAWEEETTGPILNRALHRAFHVAKRVHTEGGMGKHPASLASIAAAHAAEIIGKPARANAMVVGTGQTGTIAARRLIREGFGDVSIIGRTSARLASAANASGARPVSLGEFPAQMASAHVVVAATSARRPIIGIPEVRACIGGGREQPLVLIDLGAPRNVAPAVRRMRGVHLVTIDELRPVAEANRLRRASSTEKAEEIVAEEAQHFTAEFSEHPCTEAIRALSESFAGICRHELDRLFRKLPDLSEEQRCLVHRAATSIVAKILHAPASFLKDETQDTAKRSLSADLLRRAFQAGEGRR